MITCQTINKMSNSLCLFNDKEKFISIQSMKLNHVFNELIKKIEIR